MAKRKSRSTQVDQPSSSFIQQITKGQPGFSRNPAPGVSPRVVREILGKKDIRAKSLSRFKDKKNAGGAVKAFAAAPGVASNTVATPAMTIAELARALKNDPDLIFYHVYNNIEFHPTFGLQKGSLGVMIDGNGNAFDQCQLLVDLLTEAGFTASFLYGELDLSQDEVSAWLGTDSTSIWNSYWLLVNGGIPCEAVWTGSVYRMELSHVWVKVTIDSVDYVLDPAFKSYSTTTGINLATAMSYSQSTFLDEADDGATLTSDYAQDVNAANIASELSTYTDNLIDYIKTNNPTATMDDVLGGRTIDKIDTPVRQTVHPKQKETPTSWGSIPNSYRITVRFQCDTIDETLYGDELHGRRVTFFFNGSNEGELRVDGTLIDSISAQVTGASVSMQIDVTHPYGVTWFDQTIWRWLRAPFSGGGQAYYLIGMNFGVTGRNLLDYHQRQYEINEFSGSATDEDVLGERLAIRWQTYAGEFHAVADILGRMTNCLRNEHHHIGYTFLEDYPSIDIAQFDIQGVRGANSSLEGDADEIVKYGTALGMHGYALEQIANAQTTGNQGISTTTVIEAANAAGDKIYKATDSNWSTISSALSGYGSGDLSNIGFYTSNNWFVLVPEVAPVTIGSYDCTAYAPISPDGGAIGIINATFGGLGDDGYKPPCKCKECEGEQADPVRLHSGAFVHRQTDMTLGSSQFPYQLSFESRYDSRDRYNNGVMGLGWRHNWQISARELSEGFKGLGSYSPIDAAASIVEMFVHLDLLADTDYPVLNLVAGSLCNSWWGAQLTENAVVVNDGGMTQEFIRLPDGTYNPPLGNASTLEKNMDGSFTLTDKHQVVREFDTDGNLTSWEFPNGVTITLAYSAGKLSTISNGMGRTLTLSYTGDKLTGVSDGNGRSVSYSYTGDELDAITDLMGEDTTFSYVDDGLMESYFLPENPASPMVTNTYDSIDRIESQLDMNSEESEFYFAGWRTEFENALGYSKIWEYDRHGNTLKEVDELGNVTSFVYDSLNRLIEMVLPEGNSKSWTYDTKNNLLTETISPKPGSSLDDIVVTYTYHATFNKIATIEDGRGNTTTYSYDGSTGNLLTIERPEVDSQTPTVTRTYNGRGQILTREDETGIVTEFQYDTTTEVLEQVTVDEGMGRLNLVIVLDYNDWGDVTSVSDPRGNTTSYDFDDKRRLVQVVNASPFGYVTNITYDKNDNRLTIERQTGDMGHPWQVFEAGYNVANQVVSIKDPLENETVRQYDVLRRLWKVTDPETRVTEYQYDERSMLKKVIDPNSVESQVFTYTDNGKRASVEDGRGSITEFSFDGFDRLDKTIYPDGTFEQNASYDKNGNVLSMLTRAGDSIDFEFDVLNRMIEKSPDGMPVVTFQYDLAGRLVSASTPVVAGNPASGEWEWGYDTAGRLTSEEAPDGKTVSYELDENSNVERINYPDGYYVQRFYDELNRLTDIKLNGSMTAAAHFDYDDLSRRTALIFDNGIQTDYGYEWNDDMSSIEHAFSGSDLDFAYGFNDAHQLISQTISDAQHMWHPTVGGTAEFGNANKLNQIPYSTASCGRLFKGYNANGCLTDDGVFRYEYDAENHLISAEDGTTSVDYVYDPMHRQIQKDVDGTKTRFVYSGWQRLADYNGNSDSLQNRFVYGIGLDEPLITVSSGGALTYMHADRLGSIMALTDNTGAVTNRYAYSPWGEGDSMSGTTFGFTGQAFDHTTGLYYFKRRFYSAELGRFLQPDPIQDTNLYSYVLNDPLNMVDSLGLSPIALSGGAGGITLTKTIKTAKDLQKAAALSPNPLLKRVLAGAAVAVAVGGLVMMIMENDDLPDPDEDITPDPFSKGSRGRCVASCTLQGEKRLEDYKKEYEKKHGKKCEGEELQDVVDRIAGAIKKCIDEHCNQADLPDEPDVEPLEPAA